MVVDTVIDGNDVKIKDFDILTDLGFEEPEAKVRAKIPKEIYKKMELEDPDKYLKEDTEKAKEYFNSLKWSGITGGTIYVCCIYTTCYMDSCGSGWSYSSGSVFEEN